MGMDTHNGGKFFNTAGPGIPEDHYMIDPLRRINYGEISTLIMRKRYFALHAPRQTGKTTSLLAMAKKINEDGDLSCVYMNVEAAQTARSDVARGMRAIMTELGEKIERYAGDRSPIDGVPRLIEEAGPDRALSSMLARYCGSSKKPLVLLIDEIDALIGDTLVSALRQLRSGYPDRPEKFPISVILCGVRDVRDYRIHTSCDEIITGGSCFNIKAESLRLGDFSPIDIRELYWQHTEATGQTFEEGVYPKVWELTHGQPWLVNALADQATWKMLKCRDRARSITLEDIEEAANQLILERATHLDQLADKLHEPRVRKVIAPMVAGETWGEGSGCKPDPDDVQYAIDLGLIRRESDKAGGALVLSNEIYKEIIPRELTSIMQDNMPSMEGRAWYAAPDGRLDAARLLREFQRFFRENIESWGEGYDYKEAGFQLLLQAFLQRIVNGGGSIEREYALGRGRVDLLVRWRYPQGAPREEQFEQRIVIELKVIRGKHRSPDRTLAEGLEQTARYADQAGASEAHLLICDERAAREWDEKIYERVCEAGGREIGVWGV
jgi:hypothetical protein